MKRYFNYKRPDILIWKIAMASGGAWEVAKLAGSNHPYLAPITVILCLQVTIDQSIRYSIHRVVGTIIGVIVTVMFASFFSIHGWTLALLILIGTYIANMLKLDESVIHQVALTILLVFVFDHNSDEYGIDRIRDTVIGALVAIIIHTFIYPPDFTKHAKVVFHTFSNQLAKNVNEISVWMMNGCDKNEYLELKNNIQLLLKELHKTKLTLDKALKSLKMNPLGRRNRNKLIQYKQQFISLQSGYQYIARILPILNDWTSSGSMGYRDKEIWVSQLKHFHNYFKSLDIKENTAIEMNSLIPIVPPAFGQDAQTYHTLLYYDTEQFIGQLRK